MSKRSNYILFSLILISLSCNRASRTFIPAAQIPVENTPVILPSAQDSSTVSPAAAYKDFLEDYIINKGSIGPIRIGMTIRQADSLLTAFKKQDALAVDFGFGGGSPAFIYSYEDQPVLALVQALNTKKIFALVAISEHLKTTNEVRPQMTVEELLSIYPGMLFYQDIMNNWEYAEDPLNNWSFVFITDKKSMIGTYPVAEKPSRPKNMTARNAWITIQ